jgi:hypothetical protein
MRCNFDRVEHVSNLITRYIILENISVGLSPECTSATNLLLHASLTKPDTAILSTLPQPDGMTTKIQPMSAPPKLHALIAQAF